MSETKHSTKGTAAHNAPAQDAIELLTADHQRIARLFAQFDALKEEGSDEAKAALVARICGELTAHTTLEEEIFYPAVRQAIEEDDLMDEALVEHAGAKQLIALLRAAHPEDDLYDARVTVLGEQIDHHVGDEEGDMFPQVRGSGIDTLALGAALLERRVRLLGEHGDVPPPDAAPRKEAATKKIVKQKTATRKPAKAPTMKAPAKQAPRKRAPAKKKSAGKRR